MIEKAAALVKRFSVPIRIILVLALFTFLIYRIKPFEILIAFKSIKPHYLLMALFLMIPNIFLQFLKWKIILGETDVKASNGIVIKSLFGGFFLGAFSPGRMGEIARGVFIPGQSRLKMASLTAFDKGLNQVTVFLTGLLALSLHFQGFLKIIPLILFFIAVIILKNIILLRPFLEKIFKKFISAEKTGNLLSIFSMLKSGRLFLLSIISVLFYITYSFQYYFLLRSFSTISITQALKNLPLIYLINLLMPLGIGDFGIKETAAVFLLGAEGISGGSAFSATIVNNFMTFVIPSFIGGMLILFSRKSN